MGWCRRARRQIARKSNRKQKQTKTTTVLGQKRKQPNSQANRQAKAEPGVLCAAQAKAIILSPKHRLLLRGWARTLPADVVGLAKKGGLQALCRQRVRHLAGWGFGGGGVGRGEGGGVGEGPGDRGCALRFSFSASTRLRRRHLAACSVTSPSRGNKTQVGPRQEKAAKGACLLRAPDIKGALLLLPAGGVQAVGVLGVGD